MQRELTFYPESERTRDLLYSEYTSQDRSIHVLLQDSSAQQYRFLLEAFREVVSRYNSTTRIQSPVAFLSDLAGRLEELAKAAGIAGEDFKSMGLHVLLRATDGYYLFVSRDEGVFVHDGDEALSLSQVPGSAIERVHFDGATLQEELFPDRLKDGFRLFILDRAYFGDRDIVLGCGEENKSTVLEALSDPLWIKTVDRRNSFTSKFITRRVLVLRFGDAARVGARTDADHVRSRAKRWTVALGVGATAIVIAVGIWAMRTLIPGEQGVAASHRPVPVADGVAGAVEPGDGHFVTDDLAADTTQLSLNWRKSFGDQVTSSPVFHEGGIIFGCRDGKIYALERSTGESLWTAALTNGVGASPAVQGEVVVVADYGGYVSALAASSGERVWRRKLPGRVVSSPTVLGNRVVVGCYDGIAYCLSMADGVVLWKRETGGKIRAASAGAEDRFFVASYDGYLYALSAAAGEVEWRYPLRGDVTSAPGIYGGLVIIGAPDGNIHAISVTDGAPRWTYQTEGPVKSSLAVDDARVFVGSNDTHVYCLDAATGELVWKYKTEDLVLSRPRVVDGVVYVGSYDGYMYCIDRASGSLLDRFQTGGEIFSSPAVDDSAVYFGNNQGSFLSLKHSAKKTL